MSRFTVHETPIAGVKLIQRLPIGDSRGSLTRLFCADELGSHGWTDGIAQINHTITGARGTVRGLHYQRSPHQEAKLVSCLRGAVWDVVVDVRPDSPTYLNWHAVILSADNLVALLIPKGIAHGFQTMDDDVHLLYVHSHPHVPSHEAGLNATDPRLAINWPLPITSRSQRDQHHPMLDAGRVTFAEGH